MEPTTKFYTKLLVPLDGSQLSEQVLPYAHWLARSLPCNVDLLRVIQPVGADTEAELHTDRSVDAMTAELTSMALARLDSNAQSFGPDRTVQRHTEIGEPTEVILRTAEAVPETLIMMATHGHSGVGRWLMGSVTYQAIHRSKNPLFVVRPARERNVERRVELKTLLVPLDKSDVAMRVLPQVRELAKTLQLAVVLVSVYDPRLHGHIPYMQELDARMRDVLSTYLQEKAQQLESAGVAQVSWRTFRGNPAEEIIRFAEATPDNLIIMSTRPRSDSSRAMLGSVTNRVVCHADNPVLIIPFNGSDASDQPGKP